jgi:hypothetical protein
MSDLTLNAAHPVRQGRRPQDPPRPQDPRGAVRTRHRPGAHHPPGPRHDAGAQARQRAAVDRARGQEPARPGQGRPARPDQADHRAHRPGHRPQGREGHRRRPGAHRGRGRPGHDRHLDSNTVELEVEATRIPEGITISVEGLEAGTQILAGQVELPKGATLITDAETLVVNVTAGLRGGPLRGRPARGDELRQRRLSRLCRGRGRASSGRGVRRGSATPAPRTPATGTTSVPW